MHLRVCETILEVKDDQDMKEKTAADVLLTVCTNAKLDEKILFVTDDTSHEIAEFMWDHSTQYPNRAMVRMTDRKMHGDEPPATVAAAMFEADVIFGCTKFSMFHTAARRNAVANGARFANMADYKMSMMTEGGLFVDFIAQGERMDRLSDVIEGEEMHITTKAGTDITFSISGRKALRQYGRSLNPGQSSSPPDIETALGPVEGTANGVVVIDGGIPFPGIGVLNEEIKLDIRDGKIVDISGGEMAAYLTKAMADFNDPAVYYVAEIGIGFNDHSILCNSMLEDEGVMGTLHFGFGNSLSFGGTIDSPNHLDMIFKDASMWVDGRQLIKDGDILIK